MVAVEEIIITSTISWSANNDAILNRCLKKPQYSLLQTCVSWQVNLDLALIHKLNGFTTARMEFANNLDIQVAEEMVTDLNPVMTVNTRVVMFKMSVHFLELLGLVMEITGSGIMTKLHSRVRHLIMVAVKGMVTDLIQKKNVEHVA